MTQKDNKESHMKEHDTVKVIASKSENSLITQDFIGTIVHVYENADAVEVEDQDNNVFTVAKEAVRDLIRFEQDNELIAKFMGWKYGTEFSPDPRWKDSWFNPDRIRYDKLHFDTSWDWLIPVCRKIAEVNCDITHNDLLDMPAEFFGGMSFWADIKDVYKAAIAFIKWYNEQK